MDVTEARAVLEVGDGDGWDAVRASYRRLIRRAHPDVTGDRAGTATARRAARLNEAYAVLSRAKRAGTLDAAGPAPAGGTRANGGRPATAPPGRSTGSDRSGTTGPSARSAGPDPSGTTGPSARSAGSDPSATTGPSAGSGAAASPPPPPAVGVRLAGPDTLLLAAPPELAFALLVEAAHRVGSISYVDRSCGIFEVVVRLDGETGSLLVMLQHRGHGTEAVFALESLERAVSYVPEPIVREMIAALAS